MHAHSQYDNVNSYVRFLKLEFIYVKRNVVEYGCN